VLSTCWGLKKTMKPTDFTGPVGGAEPP